VSVLVIAEAGLLHDGSLGNAVRMAEVAAQAGADAIKFQLHDSAAEMVPSAPSPSHFDAESRWEYYERTAFTDAQWRRLKEACERAGIEFLCSCFSIEAIETLEVLGVRRHKIPSGEVTNLALVRRAAETGRPLILSSGMSSLTELDAAVAAATDVNDDVTVLQCTSAYPCPPERAGLNMLAELRRRYGKPVGFSDHTDGPYAALAAVALGATAIEKHFTLSKEMYGADARFAAEPAELEELVRGIRSIERMLSSPVDKEDLTGLREAKAVYEKSVVSRAHIPAGAVITAEMLAAKKPGTGIPAARLPEVVGLRARTDILPDSVISEADVDWGP
jgi:N-acetylneuraminate synthase